MRGELDPSGRYTIEDFPIRYRPVLDMTGLNVAPGRRKVLL